MKTLKVGIASFEEMKQKTLEIAKGKYNKNEPKIWFPSTESFAKIMSGKNRKLLELIVDKEPESLTELAKLSGRAKSNLSRTLKTMEQYGLIVFKKLANRQIAPRVQYQNISLSLSLS